MNNPKAFISYSWSSPTHRDWVLRLATELREFGVDVILDEWDLKEGYDAHAFMEQMVADADVQKVIMVCDKVYVEKANGRAGGVGAEAQIITPELYGKREQNKFVAVISERDDEGKPYVPAFYRSRIHIDMSDSEAYSTGFEQLLRWVFSKPVHLKPDLGAVPAFLKEDGSEPKLLTSAKFRRTTEMLRTGHPSLSSRCLRIFSTIQIGLEKFRIKGSDYPENSFDDAVVKSIDEFTPYRNECVTLFQILALYAQESETADAIHAFLEGLIPYMERPENVLQFQVWDFDNFRIIAHELFLYAIAVLIKYRKYAAACRLLDTDYYAKTGNRSSEMQSYCIFSSHEIRSLELYNSKQPQRRLSIHADILRQRCSGVQVNFGELQQADIVLFLRAAFTKRHWFPFTTALLGVTYGPLEIFARARSRRLFGEIAPLLGVSDVESFRAAIDTLAGSDRLPWGYRTLAIRELTNVASLATTA